MLRGPSPLTPKPRAGFSGPGLIQLHVLVDTVDGASRDPAALAGRVHAASAKAALDDVFLNHVEGRPKVGAGILAAARRQEGGRLNRRRDVAVSVAEAEDVSGGGEGVALIAVQHHAGPIGRSGEILLGLGHDAEGSFDHLAHDVAGNDIPDREYREEREEYYRDDEHGDRALTNDI